MSKAREFRTLGLVLGLVLGLRYDGSPVVAADGTVPPPEQIGEYVPSACPGGRAPHAWLADGSSLFDHFGPGFTLLATDGPAGSEALLAAAAARGVPLVLCAPGDPRLHALYGARFALIRPDQHVAWRGDTAADPDALLGHVTGLG